MAKADHKKMIPQESRLSSISGLSSFEDPYTADILSEEEIHKLDDPLAILPHDKIEAKTRNAIISMIGKKEFLETEWTSMKIQKLRKALFNPRENIINSLAQICGVKCPFIDICPYDIIGKAPIGERCPIEIRNASLLFDEYIIALADRLGEEVSDLKNDMITYNMVMGIVEADIINNRLNSMLAKDGLTQEDPAAVHQESGKVWYRTEEAAAIKIRERVNKRKEVIFEQLIATPEMQARYRDKSSTNANERLNKILERIEQKIDEPGKDTILEGEIVK